MASTYDPISIDTEELKFLADRLRALAPEALKAWRREVAALGRDIEQDAAGRASRSSRVAGSGRLRVTKWGNAVISFGGGDAYIAPIIENRGDGMVVHPVFGNLHGQASTNANGLPAFLHPALKAARPKAVIALSAAINEAIKAADLGE